MHFLHGSPEASRFLTISVRMIDSRWQPPVVPRPPKHNPSLRDTAKAGSRVVRPGGVPARADTIKPPWAGRERPHPRRLPLRSTRTPAVYGSACLERFMLLGCSTFAQTYTPATHCASAPCPDSR